MAAIKFTKPAGKAQTTTTVTDKKQTVSENTTDETVILPAKAALPVEQVAEAPCEVGIEASYTHNLGDYRSARVQVSLRVPCAKGEIDETFEQVNSWVEARMEQLVNEMTGNAEAA